MRAMSLRLQETLGGSMMENKLNTCKFCSSSLSRGKDGYPKCPNVHCVPVFVFGGNKAVIPIWRKP